MGFYIAYIYFQRSNIGELRLKFFNFRKKQKRNEKQDVSLNQIQDNSSLYALDKILSNHVEVLETYKQHYLLLETHSYAVIVEDDKNEIEYAVREPTLKPENEAYTPSYCSIGMSL